MAQEGLIRVRGGLTGVKWVKLDDWKAERKERRGKTPKAASPRQERMVQKRKNKRKLK